MSIRSCLVLAGGVLAAAMATAAEPATAARRDPDVVTKHVATVRRCDDSWANEIMGFEFEYPQFRKRSAAIAAVNRAIRDEVSVEHDLEGCAQRAHFPKRPIGSVSCACEISGRVGALLSLHCRRSGSTASGRTSSSEWFFNLDMTTGEVVTADAFVANPQEFRAMVRDALLGQNEELRDETEDGQSFLEEVLKKLTTSCGIADESVSCAATMGSHNLYEVEVPLEKVRPLLSRRYFPEARLH